MPAPLFMSDVTQPVLIKDGELLLVARPDGSIAGPTSDGVGLFYRDTRFLELDQLRLGNSEPTALMSSSSRSNVAVLELTNEPFRGADGDIERQSLGIRWERRLSAEDRSVYERIIVRNHTRKSLRFELVRSLRSRFEDVFELRGEHAKKRGRMRTPRLGDGSIEFSYAGADGIERTLLVSYSPHPQLRLERDGIVSCGLRIELEPQARAELSIRMVLEEASSKSSGPTARPADRSSWFDGAEIVTGDPGLDPIFARAFQDLDMLRIERGHSFVAGGAPWLVAPFARDSMIAAMQILPFAQEPAAETARLLASMQGTRSDPATHEEPGKIPHEIRVGEMAHLGEIPFAPGFQSIDASPLFLVLLREYARWTGDIGLFRELKPAAKAALDWMENSCGTDPDGYLRYDGHSPDGLQNQAWKDSGEAIVFMDGRLPEPPIAVVEVQALLYRAWRAMADLLELDGEPAPAERLRLQAARLRERFNRDFWMADEGCYCLALDRFGAQVDAIASNGGWALWTGIAEPEPARRTAMRLMERDVFCGWGVRTLSERARAYNPVHYHLGSVWPFDNAIFIAGLRRYGLDDLALRVFDGMVSAARYFAMGRLPEFFVGFEREVGLFPGRCPFAEPLQAWSSGAPLAALTSLLGLEPGPAGRRLTIERPVLPDGLDWLHIAGVRVGSESFELEFQRAEAGDITFEVGPLSGSDRGMRSSPCSPARRG